MIASVLIVNYNSGRALADCLDALKKQSIPTDQFETIVLDNNSRDDSIEQAQAIHDWPRFIRSAKNLGFAEGNNAAARHARSDVLVLLNPDTIPDPFWLEELLQVLHEKQAAAAVSKLVFSDDPTILNSSGLCLLRDGRGADAGFGQKDIGQFEQSRQVFAGCGAALAVRRDRFHNLFDGSLFLYYEDLDAGWQRAAGGLETWYAPRSLVLHAVGAVNNSPRHRYYVERNRALTAVRHGDLPLAIYSVLVLWLKVPQALIRWATGQWPWRTARVVPMALAGFLLHLPEAIVQRYTNRSWINLATRVRR